MNRTKILLVLTALSVCTAALAQQPQPRCSDPGFAQLDFWVGDWSLEWTTADGSTATGRNVIARDAYGDCVVTERFTGLPGVPLNGFSVSVYQPREQRWRQTWVDDSGSYIALVGGLDDDGLFSLETVRTRPDAPYYRMIWTDIEQDSLTWQWQTRQSEDDEWQDSWVIRYQRRDGETDETGS